MKKAGTADLALFGGQIPPWLFSRMKKLCLPIVEAILQDQGTAGLLSRLANPYWFQSFGAVIGMDWNSSGVTTAVMRALKESINPHAKQLGLYVCGGKGKASLNTPYELLKVADQTGLNGEQLVYASKLSAKVDNTAVQDGFNLYLHSFVVSREGDWSVVQQGMDPNTGMARRYHWHSANIRSFVENPHTAVCGDNQGLILNLVDMQAKPTQAAILQILRENPSMMVDNILHMQLPTHHEVKSTDVDIKRLGSILYLAHEQRIQTFEELLLLKGLGPRTLQSLTLVSEVIYGTPARFSDPARFSFAHGSKNGKPFAVPTKIYDETIGALSGAVAKAKIGASDKTKAIQSLTKLAQRIEPHFVPNPQQFDEFIQQEKMLSSQYGGRMMAKNKQQKSGKQLHLFNPIFD